MKSLKPGAHARVHPICGRASHARRATLILLACTATVFACRAEANLPKVPEVARNVPARDEPSAATRREPSSRHEPAMLDKLAGAELANGHAAGAVVVSVRFGSAMWRNGLRPNDLIVAIERDGVRSLDELTSALSAVAWPFTLDVVRSGRRLRIVVP